MTWKALPLPCKFYLISIWLLSIPFAFASFAATPAEYGLSWKLLTVASFTVAAINLSLPKMPSIVISMGDIFTVVVLVNYGPGPALLTYCANVIATSLTRHIRVNGFSFGRLSIHR